MQLELDRGDLQMVFVDFNILLVRYEHFEPEAQAAIRVVGKAKFIDQKGGVNESYSMIYPPKSTEGASADDFQKLLEQGGGVLLAARDVLRRIRDVWDKRKSDESLECDDKAISAMERALIRACREAYKKAGSDGVKSSLAICAKQIIANSIHTDNIPSRKAKFEEDLGIKFDTV